MMSESLGGVTFDLNDFRRQIGQLRRIGSHRELLARISGPEMIDHEHNDLESLDGEIRRMEGIIDAMTPAERRDPRILDASRRRRIASGAGVFPAEVAGLIHQFDSIAAVVRKLATMSPSRKIRMLGSMGDIGVVTSGSGRRSFRWSLSRDRTFRRTVDAPTPLEVRVLQADQSLPPLERATLRRLWEILARHGRRPSGQDPWFSNWNRNLRLWDFSEE